VSITYNYIRFILNFSNLSSIVLFMRLIFSFCLQVRKFNVFMDELSAPHDMLIALKSLLVRIIYFIYRCLD